LANYKSSNEENGLSVDFAGHEGKGKKISNLDVIKLPIQPDSFILNISPGHTSYISSYILYFKKSYQY